MRKTSDISGRQNGGAAKTGNRKARRQPRVAVDAAVALPTDATVFDRLEDRQMMAAHVAGSTASYATIQAAVNAAPAGGTVTVDAGSYAESVTIGKPLTLQGAEAGVDARSNVRTAAGVETVVTGATSSGAVGAVFYVSANDVTIDGFTVQGETSQSLSTGAGIVIAPNVSGTHVLNNVVQNNVSGLFLANASATDAAVIQHNVFRGNNNAGTNGGRGIYTDESISGGKLTNVTIDGNQFFNNRGGSGTTGLEAAVALESGSNALSQTNITITNNVFDSDGKAILCFNVTGLLFSGNVVTRGLDWYSGIVRFEGNDHNVTITGNNLFANTGPAVAVDTKGFPGDDSGFTVTGNNIYGNGTTSGKNFGVVVNGDVYDGTFDARNNYWGSASGPSGDGAGTGDSVYGQGHVVSGSSWSVTAGAGSELFAPYATAPVVTRDTPFYGLAAADGARIQAEDFDQGGQGVAYNDATSGNSGGQYRTTGVDVETTADTGGGYDVGYTAAGEWLDYAVNLAQGGTYRLDFRLSATSPGATFRVLVDGVQVGADTAAPNTGSWSTFQTVSLNGVQLTGGAHTVRILFVTNSTGGGGPDLNWFQLSNTAPITTPTAPTGLTATANGSAEVDLAWTDTATSATGVTVQRSTDGVNYSTLINLSATATAYADAGLSPLTTYYYRVVSTNVGGSSPASNVTSATTAPSSTTPTPLTALTWTSATAGWSAPQVNASIKGKPITLRGVTYATGIGTHASSTITYNLAGRFGTFNTDVGVDDEVSGQGNVRFQIYGDGALLYDSGVLTGASAVPHVSVNVTGVQTLTLLATPGLTDTIDYDHADWAGAQLLVAAPTPVVPAAPSGLTATAGSASSVYLGWTNNATNQTGFAIDRSSDGGKTFTTVANVSAFITAYTDAGLTAGTTYVYQLRATNAAGTSVASATATATTLAAAAVTTNLSALTPASATVGWGTLQDDATIKGNPITLRGTVYATGLGAHASSTITYALAGGYATFLSDVGVDDEVNGQGNVRFQVFGDGVLLYDSGVLTGTSPVGHVNVSVAGVQTLTLVASAGIVGTIDYDHADWAGAKLVAATTTPTTTPVATPTPTATAAVVVAPAITPAAAPAAAIVTTAVATPTPTVTPAATPTATPTATVTVDSAKMTPAVKPLTAAQARAAAQQAAAAARKAAATAKALARAEAAAAAKAVRLAKLAAAKRAAEEAKLAKAGKASK